MKTAIKLALSPTTPEVQVSTVVDALIFQGIIVGGVTEAALAVKKLMVIPAAVTLHVNLWHVSPVLQVSNLWVYTERVCVCLLLQDLYKAVCVGGGGDMGGHVLRETTSRGLCGLGCPSRTSEQSQKICSHLLWNRIWFSKKVRCSDAAGRSCSSHAQDEQYHSTVVCEVTSIL
jgi:hypothetical protein